MWATDFSTLRRLNVQTKLLRVQIVRKVFSLVLKKYVKATQCVRSQRSARVACFKHQKTHPAQGKNKKNVRTLKAGVTAVNASQNDLSKTIKYCSIPWMKERGVNWTCLAIYEWRSGVANSCFVFSWTAIMDSKILIWIKLID